MNISPGCQEDGKIEHQSLSGLSSFFITKDSIFIEAKSGANTEAR